MGTVRYMSPEQTMGDPDGIDTRTDVYALGVILYELLTDIAPYPTNIELTEAIKNIREFDPCRPSKLRKEINTDLDAIVLKAMSKEPARRYLSAGELGEDLLAWLDGRPVSARSTSSFYVIRKLAFRHGFETLVVATLILIIVGFSAISLENYVRAQNALEQKATSDRAVVTMQSQQDTLLNANHYPFVRRLKLGWFLLEWREGRIDEARRIQSLTAADAPEYKAMAFLLGDSNDVDQLRAALRPKEQSLADFVVGERAAKAGRIDEAIEAFEACANTAGDDLLQQPAKARLTQLRSQIKANANNAPATGDS